MGKRGARLVEPERHLQTLQLPPPNHVAYGSVSAGYYRNTVQRIPNLRLPAYSRLAQRTHKHQAAGADCPEADEDESDRVLPAVYERLRRRKVPLGKFGVEEDFSFAEHNETAALPALDNSVPNAYCNVALLMLYLLPWLRVHCLSSLMRSQFVLSDELGFLYHMMDRSRGGACQPRNFQRALHQSREATALKLVDAVDLEGNVRGGDQLPIVFGKFVSFLLETLSKEAREGRKEVPCPTLAAAP